MPICVGYFAGALLPAEIHGEHFVVRLRCFEPLAAALGRDRSAAKLMSPSLAFGIAATALVIARRHPGEKSATAKWLLGCPR